jgi:hypothetical protein
MFYFASAPRDGVLVERMMNRALSLAVLLAATNHVPSSSCVRRRKSTLRR